MLRLPDLLQPPGHRVDQTGQTERHDGEITRLSGLPGDEAAMRRASPVRRRECGVSAELLVAAATGVAAGSRGARRIGRQDV